MVENKCDFCGTINDYHHSAECVDTDGKGYGYLAHTVDQHPLTGEAVPVLKSITRETTVGELVDWYKEIHPKSIQIYDLKITEAI